MEGPNSPIFFDVALNKHEFAFKALRFEYYWISLSFLISSGEFLFCLIYWVLSIQGLIQSPVFYSLHLLDIVNRFSALNNVIKSITMNLN